MFKTQLRLGKIFGFPVRIDVSWLIIFVWVTWSLAGGYFPRNHPNWSAETTWLLAVLASLLFFGSVLLHELGHALVARGQGTPVKDITLFMFGGVAEITEEPSTPERELRMALVGPLVSLVLSALFAGIHLLTRHHNDAIATVSFFLGGINLSLGLFNLIPGYPLDGGRVLRAILWRMRRDLTWATRWASRVGQAVAYVFIIGGIVRAFSGEWVDGLWIAFIGLFLDGTARSAYAQLTLRKLLEGHSVREVMSGECHMLPPQLTLDVLIEQHLLSGASRCYTVGDSHGVRGLLTIHNVREVPKVEWPFTHVADVLTPLEQLRIVGPDTPLWDALRQMTAEGVNQLPVLSDGELLGMITRENLITFIRHRSELGV